MTQRTKGKSRAQSPAPSSRPDNARNRVSSAPAERTTAGNATELSGAALLIHKLEGVVSEGKYHWKALCPCHDDNDPSLLVDVRLHDVRRVTFARCVACGANGVDVCRLLGLPLGRVLYGNPPDDRPKRSRVEPLGEEKVTRYVSDLWDDPKLLDYLHTDRGLGDETLRRYEIGWDSGRERYTIPIRDRHGDLVNLRRYRPSPPADVPKMINAKGHGSPARLYPLPLPSGNIVVCEGEWDCLLLNQHGIPAVTSTHGAGAWREEWNALFVGRPVAYLYDVGADHHATDHATGLAATRGHAQATRAAPRRQRQRRGGVGGRAASSPASVRVVHLGFPRKGDDVTDWFVTYGRTARELRDLINASAPLGRGKGGRL